MSDRSNPDPFVIQKSRTMNKRVKLNVGGIRHEIMWKVLECVPNSRLGMLAKVNHNEKRCQTWINPSSANYLVVDKVAFHGLIMSTPSDLDLELKLELNSSYFFRPRLMRILWNCVMITPLWTMNTSLTATQDRSTPFWISTERENFT